jgi:glycosyltransferase involved in cell wall biosynthesis
MLPLVNILIRTSYRPSAFARCIASVANQTYKNIRVIVSYDDDRALEYIPDWCENLPVIKSTEPYGYNLYCNDLKAQVKEGWFFFLDDDDRLASDTVLEELVNGVIQFYPPGHVFIVQFIRGNTVKPCTTEIIMGKIGMPCIIMHSKNVNAIDFIAKEYADYTYIRAASERFDCTFLDLILVRTSRRGHGYVEDVLN